MYMLPEDNTVEVRILEKLLDLENLSTSYKLFWFAGILEEIKQGKQEMSFRRIVCRMLTSAWYPLLQYHLNLGVGDQINSIVNLLHTKYGIATDVRERDLLDFLEKLKDPEVEKAIRGFYNYVPYRLLSPFFTSSLVGVKDHLKNKIIADLSQNNSKALYKINQTDERIHLNYDWFDYIYRNQSIVSGWHNYKMIYYLQKKNPNIPAIPFKLSMQSKRNLHVATKFWNSVKEQQLLHDIYTGHSMIKDNFKKHGEMSIDHFIPWSFVLHDELWNLVPTFKNINSSKNNKLPQIDLFMDKPVDRV